MHQQVVTGDVLSIAKFVQACPQPFESAATHGTFLGYTVVTFHINIEFRLLLKNFNADTFTRLNPRLFGQLFFNAGQMSPGGTDQIINPPRTHLFQHLLGRDTAIHKPGTSKISHTVFQYDPEIPPMLQYLLYFQDILRRPRENLPASTLMPQPLERNPNVCHGCVSKTFFTTRSRRRRIAFKIRAR